VFKERIIRDLNQNKYTFDEFISMIKVFDEGGYDFYIGTDSQIIKRKISIVTCVCAVKEGEGKNKVFYVKERIKRREYPTLRTRMLLEAYRSIEAAMEIDGLVMNKLTIHLDVGDDNAKPAGARHSATTACQQELQFLVKAQGYNCFIKDNAWAASSVADRMVKS
jgi:predicted RNase H-related nuclease YkuK (DUF458 family)